MIGLWWLLPCLAAGAQKAAPTRTLSDLPANTWTLIHKEDASGGKTFARAVWAANVGQLYLWGAGGKKPARNVYLRYELEALRPSDPKWLPAFPRAMAGKWTARKYPPFRIWGQGGPDGLKYHEGPRLMVRGETKNTRKARSSRVSKAPWLSAS